MKNYGYRNVNVPCAQFTAEGGYYLKFLSDPDVYKRQVSCPLAGKPTAVIQPVVLWKMLYSFTIGFSRFFETLQII